MFQLYLCQLKIMQNCLNNWTGFKRTINWDKYEPKVTVEQQNRYLDFLINPSFQGVNRLFVLVFENTSGRISNIRYYLQLLQINYYNVVIDGRNVFDQPLKNDLIKFVNTQKIRTGRGDDYTTGCLLDYNYFHNYYKMVAIDLIRQYALDADPNAMLQINLTANLDWDGNTAVFFINEEAKETILDFSPGVVKVFKIFKLFEV